ncbi:glycerol kinase GlpK [Novosphingobium sp. Gsoil 351]|uniref:glycerol kinase GlpK n=1 Tax=Novosphingobium sp. Gsoil 351 TaxID=2675225 RepID=UPI0012B44DA7|nr:glycerol kinase GlpK [Novosphingobium sp. Gsoil 351]QGN54530.1 glycerol kinase GlpK [Novosphingobium sp. Gsoil 351]
MTDLILVLDAGTTSTRAMAFARDGSIRAVSQCEITQHYPQPGWVEHDAQEIWEATLRCARACITAAGGAAQFAAIGITNQRETVVAWDRTSGEPLARAIVWQDRRTAEFCDSLRTAGHEPAVQHATGLLLDPYFSATKMRWLLDNSGEVAAAARTGVLAFGTVESWLVWKLTGATHVSDASNASRTLLLALDGPQFDPGLCDLFGVPLAALPQVVDCAGEFGTTLPGLFDAPLAIRGLAGDQQAATVGQGCNEPGEVKATYGTGAFVLANMGAVLPRSRHRLLGTVLTQLGGRRTYALEGSVFVAGSLVKWLRDSLGIIASASETAALAASVPDTGGVVLVPALSGLGAPHWRPDARAALTGMSFATTRAHLARAALEATANQTRDLMDAFAADGAPWAALRIDGGMSANDWLAQDLANILGIAVERPEMVETTALGAAMLAAVASGWFADLDEAAKSMRGPVVSFTQAMDGAVKNARLAAWREAVAKV